MQSLIVTFVAKVGREQPLETELLGLVRNTATEPGAIAYELSRGAPGSRAYYLYERYTDAEALKTHSSSAYFHAALPRVGALLDQPPTLVACDFITGL